MYQKFCSKCGCTWQQFVKTGVFGCPDCYVEFKRELIQTLKKIQKTPYHKGAKPKISGEDKQLFDEYIRLLKEKEMAGLNSDFTKVAEVSLELNALIKDLKERGII